MSEDDLHQRLLATFSYCPSGRLIWLTSKYNPWLVGKPLGSKHKTGYLVATWLGKSWKVHRLIVLYHTGKLPVGVVDHINRNKTDNRIENLRCVSLQTNRQNITNPQSNNKLGVLGVQRVGNRYRARIRINGVLLNLGSFLTAEAASAAYILAKRILHSGYVHEN